jgi:pyridinium-3,5-biscarboxylic acid mononucleotide synthase
MDHIVFDAQRAGRIGLPEAVFCQNKTFDSLKLLLTRFNKHSGHAVLFTRLQPEIFFAMPPEVQQGVHYHALSCTAYSATLPACPHGRVAIVSAGTADAAVTTEAAQTLHYLGIAHRCFEDCGVAGLWRIMEALPHINACDVVIVVAGMDAALSTVLGGLCPKPLFAVPTSVGYGIAQQGSTALASMLASCAPGIGVLNIDNGYGAACAAARVIYALDTASSAEQKDTEKNSYDAQAS